MSVRVELLRADDLLNLTIVGENLRLDASDPANPALVLDDPDRPGHLVVTFPPQSVVEQAFFESSPTPPPPPAANENGGYNTVHPAAAEPALPVAARIAGASRLVFRIPAGSGRRIPYDIEGLLDWEGLEFAVAPLADVPALPTAEQRRSAPAIHAPAPLETAIELPYRLIISPNRAAVWKHARRTRVHAGFTELWHTRLAARLESGEVHDLSRARTAPLRAIWSPDFNSKKFNAADTPVFGKGDADWPGVLTPMTPSDRHELVVLTSAFSGYVKDKDDFSPYEPRPFNVEQLMLSPLGGWLRSRGEWDPPAPFKPLTIVRDAGRARLTALISELSKVRAALPPVDRGAHMHDRAARLDAPQPAPAAAPLIIARDDAVFAFGRGLDSIVWPRLTGTTGDLLNLSEWSHIATLGRDHYVRIVYEGHLYPFGHRASLVKITERKIRDVPKGSAAPVAYLVQRMFIVVRKPLRDYRAPEVRTELEDGGRALPFDTLRLTTLVTPDIADPSGPSKIPGTIYSFWVRLGSGASPADDFKFHAIAADIAGDAIDFTASLVFIPFGESSSGRQSVVSVYATSGEARACIVPGQKVTYAPSMPGAANENTSLTTQKLYFTSQPAPFNKTFGAFLPRLFKTAVKLPAIEALLGRPAETELAYHDTYLKNAPGNVTGLYARVVKETAPGKLDAAALAAEFSADKGGGFATPNLSISTVTSKLGPLAGDAAKAAGDTFDPADFFKDMKDSAKLFGTFSLADLLGPLTMSAGAPKVQFAREDAGAAPPAQKLRLVTTLDWTPAVKDKDLDGIVTFHASIGAEPATLAVHGRMEKVVELPPPAVPDAGHATMAGELKNFRIELLHVVEVLFRRFAFTAETGRKVDVQVALDSNTPVRFIEDLQFVDELRQRIPAGLFGDGPSLDINADRVKAGFSIGLPPVAVGVFALRDVGIGAFIELPFRDGKPLFDFGFSSREHPFNLTVAFLGGGGFFHLQLDTKGVRLLEAALEFGASASIDLGVASGGVHIMAGIYFSLQRRKIGGVEVMAATLAGYLRMGGELSVLGIISVSLEFYLCFAYEEVKTAYGRATLTVKVEVLMFSKSVEISVEKRFGGASGDPLFIETFDQPSVWQEYAGAFA